jgi:hypothetical protein
MVWTNADGLRVKFGVEEAEKALVTEITSGDYKRTIEILVDPARLPAVADNSVLIDDSYVIPAGAQFTSVEILTSDAFTAGTGILNVGITDADGGSALTDVDAFVVGATVAELNIGGVNLSGWIGDLVNDGTTAGTTPLSKAGLLTWEVDTAAIVGGYATIRIQFSLPKAHGDTLVWTK